MKRFIIAATVILMACSCSQKLYNVTKAYDDKHFAKLQQVLDNPTTPKGTSYSFTEASDIGLVGKCSTTPPTHTTVSTPSSTRA